jgi:hypothetical protein
MPLRSATQSRLSGDAPTIAIKAESHGESQTIASVRESFANELFSAIH